MAPAVAEAAQVRWPVPPIRVQNYRHLADLLAVQARLDDHLAGELHPGGAQVQTAVRVSAERAQTAMGIANRAMKEEVQDAGENRIAYVTMQPGHRAGSNAA